MIFRDRWDETPLLSAISGRHIEVIGALKEAGGTISLTSGALSVALCMLAATNDLRGLKSWKVAGADLNSTDYDGRTPLHVVSHPIEIHRPGSIFKMF